MKQSKAVAVVEREIFNATAKNGEFNSAHEGYAVLLEEVEELWDDIKANKGYTVQAAEEAKQVAAMAIRYLIDFGAEEWYDENGNRNFRQM